MILTFLRSIIYFLLMLSSIILFGSLLALLGRFIPLSWRNNIGNNWSLTNLILQKVICGLSYRIIGKENIPTSPSIVMSKHQSAWETIALRHIFRRNQSWVLKKELMQIPIFGWAMAVMSPIAIDRKIGYQAIRKLIDRGTKSLKDGHLIIIFPEGTRIRPGERGHYNLGGSILAKKSGYPIIPVAHNAGIFWKRRGFLKYPGIIDVIIGRPIKTKGKSAQIIMREVEDWIENEMKNIPGPKISNIYD